MGSTGISLDLETVVFYWLFKIKCDLQSSVNRLYLMTALCSLAYGLIIETGLTNSPQNLPNLYQTPYTCPVSLPFIRDKQD